MGDVAIRAAEDAPPLHRTRSGRGAARRGPELKHYPGASEVGAGDARPGEMDATEGAPQPHALAPTSAAATAAGETGSRGGSTRSLALTWGAKTTRARLREGIERLDWGVVSARIPPDWGLMSGRIPLDWSCKQCGCNLADAEERREHEGYPSLRRGAVVCTPECGGLWRARMQRTRVAVRARLSGRAESEWRCAMCGCSALEAIAKRHVREPSIRVNQTTCSERCRGQLEARLEAEVARIMAEPPRR
jgi:hypothetical protein